MSLQLFTHGKQDLEKAVEIILSKFQHLQTAQPNITANEREDLISQKKACLFLKVSIPTIIHWRKEKGLPHYNFNGRFFYSESELLAYGKKKNQ